MYARTGKLAAQSGRRDEFVALLLEAAAVVGESADCLLYLVAKDLTDDNAIIVMELWANKEAHAASLQDERVRALIGQGLGMMAGTPEGSEMEVVGGHRAAG